MRLPAIICLDEKIYWKNLYFTICDMPRLFKAWALWADAFYKSKCLSVCVSVCVFCLSVCSLLRYRLNVFLPPLPKVGCPILLEIRNPWGKVLERSGLRFEHFCLQIVKNRRANKSFFLLILPYKTWWKPRFPMD